MTATAAPRLTMRACVLRAPGGASPPPTALRRLRTGEGLRSVAILAPELAGRAAL